VKQPTNSAKKPATYKVTKPAIIAPSKGKNPKYGKTKPAKSNKPKTLAEKKKHHIKHVPTSKQIAQKIAKKCAGKKIKAPMKISEPWLKMNNLDVDYSRKLENNYQKLADLVATVVDNNDYGDDDDQCVCPDDSAY